MEDSKASELRRIVSKLTTSGQSTLDKYQLTSLKKICRSSDQYIEELFKILMKQLRKNHAEIRFSAFQICNEIFNRSECFRQLILKKAKELFNLVIIFEGNTIPKPLSVAHKLRKLAIECVRDWYKKFNNYSALKVGYKYLCECKNVNFDELSLITNEERQRRDEENLREEENKARKIKKVLDEVSETSNDISNVISEFKTTFKLLIPDLDNFFIPLQNDEIDHAPASSSVSEYEETDFSYEFGSNTMREHGLTKETNIKVNLSDIHTIYETEDNEIIITTLKEQIGNIKNSFLPKVRSWEKSVMQYSSSNPDIIQSIVDLKQSLQSTLTLYSSINIIRKSSDSNLNVSSSSKVDSSDDDSNDFIDVPFEDQQISSCTFPSFLSKNLIKKNNNQEFASSHDLNEAGPSGVSSSLVKRDLTIENFLKEKWEAPLKFSGNVNGLSNVWSSNEVLHDIEEENIKRPSALGLTTKVIEFQREFEPVHWECRAPLPTGRLCPRKDRECCPLHGPVIPRDELGQPLNPEDKLREQERRDKYEREHPEWQNPTLLAEIKATTGLDLNVKKAKKRKKRFPNLTDIKALENTPRKRLESKIFSKNSVRKLNKALSKSTR